MSSFMSSFKSTVVRRSMAHRLTPMRDRLIRRQAAGRRAAGGGRRSAQGAAVQRVRGAPRPQAAGVGDPGQVFAVGALALVVAVGEVTAPGSRAPVVTAVEPHRAAVPAEPFGGRFETEGGGDGRAAHGVPRYEVPLGALQLGVAAGPVAAR